MFVERHPLLAKGETMPDRPVYWLIWVLDSETGKPRHSRCCWDKVLTPDAACRNAYGMPPTGNMRFFNLTHRVLDARRNVKRIAELWRKAGGTY